MPAQPPRKARWAVAALAALIVTPAALADAPAPLARYFPAKDLVAYGEFDGLEVHSASWKKTAAYRLLTETTTGAMLEATAEGLLDRVLEASPPPSNVKLSGKEMLAIVKMTINSGFAFGVNRRPDEPKAYAIGLVVRGAARGEAAGPIRRLLDAGSAEAKAQVVAKAGGRKLTVAQGVQPGSPGVAWWFEKDDLAFSFPAPGGPDAMIEALDGKAPDATKNPLRMALAKGESGFEPVGLAFVEKAIFPSMPPQAARLGLDKIERLDYRWGFQGDALMTVTRLIAPAPRTGLLALFDHPTFGVKTLPPIPPGITGFTVFSLDVDRLYERFVAIAEMGDPNSRAQADAMEGAFQEATGQKLREDLLKHLGPRVATFTFPTRGELPTNPFLGFASGLVHVPKTVSIVELRDPDGFAKAFDALVAKANEAIRMQFGGGDPARPASGGFRPLKGKEKGYVFAMPTGGVGLPAGMRPTFLLGKKYLVAGTTPDVARRALALEDKAAAVADGPLAGVLAKLPDHMMMLTVSDTRESMLPEVVANLPGLISAFGSLSGGPQAGPAWARFLGMRGPRPGGPGGGPNLVVNVDPELVPDPDALRPFLFPATYALTATDQGFSFVSRESFPGLNPTTAAPIAVAMLLPAVTSARSAARRAQSTNNLKQIALAMHNYESANGHLPGTVRDGDGKPLLSWRVQLLPYMEQAGLYNEFHLDEPWDSAHNKPLMERMPAIFAVPGAAAAPGKTFYRSFSGPGTLFEADNDGFRFATITDGTSNTIGAVEAKEAVEWTKPGNEIPFDMQDEDGKALLGKLGGHSPGGFNAMMLDGSVRFLKQTINGNVLKALITRNGGEVVQAGAF